MQMFSGAFKQCTDLTKLTKAECLGDRLNKIEPVAAGRMLMEGNYSSAAGHDWLMEADHHRMLKGGSSHAERELKGAGSGSHVGPSTWDNPAFGSFDDFGQSMILLLVLATGDNWDTIMFHAMDGPGDPTDPASPRGRNDFSAASLFFIIWMFVGSFFAMQLFVGVVVDQFNTIKAHKDGTATMTAEQAAWVETQKAMANAKGKGKPRRPTTTGVEGVIDMILYKIVANKGFTYFIFLMVAANVTLLGYDHWGMTKEPEVEALYETALHAFSILFYVEALCKYRVYGKIFYFRDEWCRLELRLVALSLLEQSEIVYIISEHIVQMPPAVLRIPSALLALRVLRLLAVSKELEKLVTVITLSIPSLINVLSLLVLVIFIYSILGVQLFTFISKGYYINEHRNFDNFGNAMLANIQQLTGDSWSTMMYEARTRGTASDSIVQGFFVSFQVICGFVILNLLVAVILENFSSMGGGNSDLISRDDMDTFAEAWSDYDHDASQKIDPRQLPDLLRAIPQPMGLEARLALGLYASV